MDTLSIILTASAVVLGIVGFLVGIQYRKQIAEKTIGSAENRAKIIIKDAEKEAQAKKKEILVVPCDDFGVKGYVRIAYCVDKARIEGSLPAFKALAEEYKGK